MLTTNNKNLISKIFIAVTVLFTLFIYSCNNSGKKVKTETVTTPVTTDTMMKMQTDTMKHDTSGKDKGGQPTPTGN